MDSAKVSSVAVLAASAIAGGLATTTEEASKIAVDWYGQLLSEIAEQERSQAARVNQQLGI